MNENNNKIFDQAELLDLAHDSIMVRDLESRIIYWNNGAAERYGWTREEVLGRVTHDLLNTIFPIPLENIHEELFEKGYWEGELTHTIKNGSKIIVSSRWQLKRDASNTPVAIFEINNDITRRKEAENDLREREKQFHLLLRSMGEGFGLMDDKEVFRFVNASAERIFGVEEGTLTGLCLFDFLDSAAVEKINRETILRKEGISSTYEIQIVLRDGTRKDLFVTAAPTFDGDKFIGTTGVFRDISEMKRTEKAMHDNEQLFRGMFEDHSAAKILIDPLNGSIIDANFAAARFYGYSRATMKTLNVSDLNTASKSEIGVLLKRAANQPSNYFNFQHRLASGELREIEVYSGPVEFKGQKLLFAIIHDVTERTKARESLIESENNLKNLNITKDKFFSIIAHDLRSPFNGFLGLIKIMDEKFFTLTLEQIRNFIHTMGDSASSLFRLLENLLEWSRLQQGLSQVTPVSLFLKQRMKEGGALVLESARQKNIELRYEIPDDISVYADEQMVDSIFRNLISNAIKFTPQGGKVTISAKQFDQTFVEISVTDTGIGMKQEIMNNLFRIDVNTSREGTIGEPSSGLGLVLVKEFIQRNGGTIHVESEVGKGSSFHFTLPCK